MNSSVIGVVPHKRMSIIESVVFVFVFILPFFFYATSTEETGALVQYGAFIAIAVLFVTRLQYLVEVINGPFLAIVLLYFLGIMIKFLVYGKFSMMGAVMPLAGLFGYYYVDNKRIRLEVFDGLLLALYVYFIYTFFFHLDGSLIRVQMENEGDYFGRSSTNFIPIILINVLYIYQVLAYLQKDNRRGRFLLYSSINLILILIQQSRSGIILGAVFFLYNLYIWGGNKKSFFVRAIPFIITAIIVVFVFRFGSSVMSYADQLGEAGFSYTETRGLQAAQFFKKMDLQAFLFGYPSGTEFGDESYVYNTFLNQWNVYTLIGFMVTVILLLRRVLKYKMFYFPWYYLIPFILYSFSEPRYLPNYWDFFIYLLLLKKKDATISTYQ